MTTEKSLHELFEDVYKTIATDATIPPPRPNAVETLRAPAPEACSEDVRLANRILSLANRVREGLASETDLSILRAVAAAFDPSRS
jgi:hypothetical protein